MRGILLRKMGFPLLCKLFVLGTLIFRVLAGLWPRATASHAPSGPRLLTTEEIIDHEATNETEGWELPGHGAQPRPVPWGERESAGR